MHGALLHPCNTVRSALFKERGLPFRDLRFQVPPQESRIASLEPLAQFHESVNTQEVKEKMRLCLSLRPAEVHTFPKVLGRVIAQPTAIVCQEFKTKNRAVVGVFQLHVKRSITWSSNENSTASTVIVNFATKKYLECIRRNVSRSLQNHLLQVDRNPCLFIYLSHQYERKHLKNQRWGSRSSSKNELQPPGKINPEFSTCYSKFESKQKSCIAHCSYEFWHCVVGSCEN
ncbi:hypothetical protein CDAR_573271 [Caerostris darwini]|uniref:Uncharacterized protein n=1 Tax=Caerostris darwini TaxID=1538125 RepID=A0AAV4M6U6_9ARAC|nr:hypothetical protein CDAR_573271 [Caerostris darwini]